MELYLTAKYFAITIIPNLSYPLTREKIYTTYILRGRIKYDYYPVPNSFPAT